MDAREGSRAPSLPGALRFPEGTWVRGRSLRRGLPPGPLPDLGLYLAARRPWRAGRWMTWETIWIPWPDFGTPAVDEEAVGAIVSAFEGARAGRRVEVACAGGTGRTGTVLACMAMLAGVAPERALSWVRANYHPRAVETRGQREWIERFAKRVS